MSAKMRNILRTTRVQFHRSAIKEFPKLSASELARSSWAKSIESCSDLPEDYKVFYASVLADGRPFPYTVMTPSHERFIHKTTEKLISDFRSKIIVLEKNGNIFEAQYYPLDGITCIEIRTALLASSVKICGLTKQAVHTSSTLTFNSVTDYLFTPILEKARLGTADSRTPAQRSETEQFDPLIKVNFKFMNYAKHSLLAGEKVIHFILQPEIRENFFTVLGKSYYKTISPTHMIIFTDRELIVIREEDTRRKEDRYGGVWDYIPLNKIDSLSLSKKDGNVMELSVRLAGNIHLDFLYQGTAQEAVDRLLYLFRQ